MHQRAQSFHEPARNLLSDVLIIKDGADLVPHLVLARIQTKSGVGRRIVASCALRSASSTASTNSTAAFISRAVKIFMRRERKTLGVPLGAVCIGCRRRRADRKSAREEELVFFALVCSGSVIWAATSAAAHRIASGWCGTKRRTWHAVDDLIVIGAAGCV